MRGKAISTEPGRVIIRPQGQFGNSANEALSSDWQYGAIVGSRKWKGADQAKSGLARPVNGPKKQAASGSSDGLRADARSRRPSPRGQGEEGWRYSPRRAAWRRSRLCVLLGFRFRRKLDLETKTGLFMSSRFQWVTGEFEGSFNLSLANLSPIRGLKRGRSPRPLLSRYSRPPISNRGRNGAEPRGLLGSGRRWPPGRAGA